MLAQNTANRPRCFEDGMLDQNYVNLLLESVVQYADSQPRIREIQDAILNGSERAYTYSHYTYYLESLKGRIRFHSVSVPPHRQQLGRVMRLQYLEPARYILADDVTKDTLSSNAVANLSDVICHKPLLFKYARAGSKLEGVWHMESISSTHVVIVRNTPTFHDTHIVDQGRSGRRGADGDKFWSRHHYRSEDSVQFQWRSAYPILADDPIWSEARLKLSIPGLGRGNPTMTNRGRASRSMVQYVLEAVANYHSRSSDLNRNRSRDMRRAMARRTSILHE